MCTHTPPRPRPRLRVFGGRRRHAERRGARERRVEAGFAPNRLGMRTVPDTTSGAFAFTRITFHVEATQRIIRAFLTESSAAFKKPLSPLPWLTAALMEASVRVELQAKNSSLRRKTARETPPTFSMFLSLTSSIIFLLSGFALTSHSEARPQSMSTPALPKLSAPARPSNIETLP